MSLDPDAELVLGMIRASGRPPVQALSPQQAREVYRASRKAVTPEPPDVAQVDDLAAPGPGGAMALRMYRGLGSSRAPPVLVFFHGGGFCIGDLDRCKCSRSIGVVSRSVATARAAICPP